MWRWWVGLIGAAVLVALGFWWGPAVWRRAEAPIVVGLLHSRTGPLALNEKAMLDAEVMAIEEINEAGGLLGRRVKYIIADGESDPRIFGREARRLIEAEKVDVIFGAMTSACRRAVDEVVTPADHLFIFPSNYEGMDFSPNIICTGPLPNQQVIPAVTWCRDALKAQKFFLAGSDDVFSYAVNTIVKDQLKALGADCVGEGFASIEGRGVADLVAAIEKAKPDVVLSTVVGEANKEFHQELADVLPLPDGGPPVVGFTISEEELRELPEGAIAGHYAAGGYFQSLDSPENREFIARFQKRWGADRPTSDPIVSAYNGVRLWALAVKEAGASEAGQVRKHLRRQSRVSAAGIISVDYDTLHSWRPFHLGKARRDGQFDVVWSLDRPIRPVPFPMFRSRSYWEAAVEKWFRSGYPSLGESPDLDAAAPAEPEKIEEPKPGPDPDPEPDPDLESESTPAASESPTVETPS